jgi:hypothetical protein
VQVPHTRFFAFIVAASMFGGIASAARDAHADPSEGGAAAAESLFQEARKLMDAKRYSEACPKLVASHKLAPAVGTLLNLADCYERAGQNASAWARFHEAIALAQRLGRPDREKTARERADKLEPRLIKLTITAQDTNLDVKLDGNALDSSVLGTAVPVDPGKHTVDAKAKGKKAFSTTIDVSERIRTPSVEIPALEAETETATGGPNGGGETHPPDETKDGSTQRIVGLVVMGVGVAGAAVGTIFGLKTSSTWSDAQTHCAGTECDRTGVQLASDAKNAGTVSTISFIAGGALLAGGAIIYFTAPSGPAKKESTTGKAPVSSPGVPGAPAPRDLRVGVGAGSVLVSGRF